VIFPEVIPPRRSGSGEEMGEELEIEEDELVAVTEVLDVVTDLEVEEDELVTMTEDPEVVTDLDEVVNEVSARRAITRSSGHVGSSQTSAAIPPWIRQRERTSVMIRGDRVRGQVDNMAIGVRLREGCQSDQISGGRKIGDNK